MKIFWDGRGSKPPYILVHPSLFCLATPLGRIGVFPYNRTIFSYQGESVNFDIQFLHLRSFNHPNQIFAVETSQSKERKYTLKNNTYECNGNKVFLYSDRLLYFISLISAMLEFCEA